MGTRDALTTLQRLARAQWGLVTTQQATVAGATRVHLTRLTAAGELQPVTYGVHALPDVELDDMAVIHALWLAVDPSRTARERLKDLPTSGVLSHATAAGLHGLAPLATELVEVTLQRRYRPRREDLTAYRALLVEDDVVVLDGLPVTSLDRTTQDLGRLAA